MKPMLAHKYKPAKHRWPSYVQPKLNGLRALWLPGVGLQSRGLPGQDGVLWDSSTIPHIFAELSDIPIPVDSELYCHGMSLQQINSRVGVNRKSLHPEAHLISMNVFDTVSMQPFRKRKDFLDELSARSYSHVLPVETTFCADAKLADALHRHYTSAGYEGSILRDPDSPYGFLQNCGNQENRWNCLLKRKDWQDLDAIIIGFFEEEDQHGQPKGRLGSFNLRSPRGTEFSAGSGLTDYQRSFYWNQKPALLGRSVKIKFETYSDSHIPLKPIVLLVSDEHLYV